MSSESAKYCSVETTLTSTPETMIGTIGTLTIIPPHHTFVEAVPLSVNKVIKNISVLKCKCCDAKLDSDKMVDNIIKCEYCDSDNYIKLEDE